MVRAVNKGVEIALLNRVWKKGDTPRDGVGRKPKTGYQERVGWGSREGLFPSEYHNIISAFVQQGTVAETAYLIISGYTMEHRDSRQLNSSSGLLFYFNTPKYTRTSFKLLGKVAPGSLHLCPKTIK